MQNKFSTVTPLINVILINYQKQRAKDIQIHYVVVAFLLHWYNLKNIYKYKAIDVLQ